jgi:nucleotide-binding universal stress UspA family protein
VTNSNTNESSVGKDGEPVSVSVESEPVFRRILVPIDKSGGFKSKVILYGIKLAKALGSEITVIHVINEAGSSLEGKTEAYEDDSDGLKNQAEKILREAQLQGEKEGVRIAAELVTHVHSIGEAIIDTAKKKDIDLILLGSKGLVGSKGFLTWTLGSVANEVISYAHCAVLAVR